VSASPSHHFPASLDLPLLPLYFILESSLCSHSLHDGLPATSIFKYSARDKKSTRLGETHMIGIMDIFPFLWLLSFCALGGHAYTAAECRRLYPSWGGAPFKLQSCY